MPLAVNHRSRSMLLSGPGANAERTAGWRRTRRGGGGHRPHRATRLGVHGQVLAEQPGHVAEPGGGQPVGRFRVGVAGRPAKHVGGVTFGDGRGDQPARKQRRSFSGPVAAVADPVAGGHGRHQRSGALLGDAHVGAALDQVPTVTAGPASRAGSSTQTGPSAARCWWVAASTSSLVEVTSAGPGQSHRVGMITWDDFPARGGATSSAESSTGSQHRVRPTVPTDTATSLG